MWNKSLHPGLARDVPGFLRIFRPTEIRTDPTPVTLTPAGFSSHCSTRILPIFCPRNYTTNASPDQRATRRATSTPGFLRASRPGTPSTSDPEPKKCEFSKFGDEKTGGEPVSVMNCSWATHPEDMKSARSFMPFFLAIDSCSVAVSNHQQSREAPESREAGRLSHPTYMQHICT